VHTNVTIYLCTKLRLLNPAVLSTKAEFLSKHLYCCHLVAKHSVNIAASEKFHASPLSATNHNSM